MERGQHAGMSGLKNYSCWPKFIWQPPNNSSKTTQNQGGQHDRWRGVNINGEGGSTWTGVYNSQDYRDQGLFFC